MIPFRQAPVSGWLLVPRIQYCWISSLWITILTGTSSVCGGGTCLEREQEGAGLLMRVCHAKATHVSAADRFQITP